MDLIEKIKYVYLFILFLALIRTLFFTCLKITEFLLPVLKRNTSIPVEEIDPYYYLKIISPRILFLSLIGVIVSMAIFTMLADNTFIDISKQLILKLNYKVG